MGVTFLACAHSRRELHAGRAETGDRSVVRGLVRGIKGVYVYLLLLFVIGYDFLKVNKKGVCVAFIDE